MSLNKEQLLNFLSERNRTEQEFFWQRFYAFATLHAGVLVLMTSSAISNKSLLAIVGVVLSLIWFYVQWASLYYANRWKEPFRKLLDELDIHDAGKGVFVCVFGKRPWASSTNAGFFTTWIVCGVWIWLSLRKW